MLEDEGWELRWPADLLVSEGNWVLSLENERGTVFLHGCMNLLEEAFVGNAARDAFLSGQRPDGGSIGPAAFMGVVIQDAPLFTVAGDRPYWPSRRGVGGKANRLNAKELQVSFAALIAELDGFCYLELACRSRGPRFYRMPDALRNILQEGVGVVVQWPLEPNEWDQDTFYGLVEVFHDLVARPRKREAARTGREWDCDQFARSPAQTAYRWRVNRLFERSSTALRLADTGEDKGRLVAAVDEARDDLASCMAERDDPGTSGPVRHAIALHRSRAATEHDTRSAVIALAGVLEERRNLLKAELFAKDEGALFQIANQFGIRHQTADQLRDYDPMFLDWVFWWYLATIELSDRLLARQAGSAK